jgi:O-antigen ligase
MFFIILITLLSGCLPNEWVVEGLRFSIGPIPINVLDVLLLLGVIGVVFVRTAPEYRPGSVHPLFTWTLVLFVIAGFAGSFAAFGGQHDIRDAWYMRCVRHYMTMPAAMIMAYGYVRTPRASLAMIVVHLIAGIVSAVLIALFFHSKTVEYSGYDLQNVNVFRTVQYIASYSTIAAAVLIFARINRIRLLPWPIALVTIMVCLTGVFVTLTRSDWVACFAALVPAIVLTPAGVKLRNAVRALPTAAAIALALALAVFVTSQVTQKDFSEKVHERLLSMLPWDTSGNGATESKAWDTRMPGMMQELDMWSASPLVGQGFGSQYAVFFELRNGISMRHNAFTSILAEAGLLGIVPVLLMFGGMFVVGWRLIRGGVDRSTVLAGAFAMIVASHYVVKGLSTMSFNNEREGMIVGLAFGMVLRMRGVDQAIRRWYAGYLDEPAQEQAGIATGDQDGAQRPVRDLSGGFGGGNPAAEGAATATAAAGAAEHVY